MAVYPLKEKHAARLRPSASQLGVSVPNRRELVFGFVFQLLLTLPIIISTSPTVDELAHLASGLYHWQTGRFDSYQVNPPLIRLLYTAPLALFADVPDLRVPTLVATNRYEWQLDDQLLAQVPIQRILIWLRIARSINAGFAVLGAYYCYRWGACVYGAAAGRVAAILWICSPNILAWSCTLSTDVSATSLGIAALFHYSFAQQPPARRRPCLVGVLAGLAASVKTTWLLLGPVFVFSGTLRVLKRLSDASSNAETAVRSEAKYLAIIGTTAIMVLHAGYGFVDVWPLATASHRITGAAPQQVDELVKHRADERATPAERSAARNQSAALKFSIPTLSKRLAAKLLPTNLVRGIEIQRDDFARGKRSFLLGHWRDGGWGSYYLACLLVKTPAAVLLMLALSVATYGKSLPRTHAGHTTLLGLRHLSPLLVFALVISCHSGFSHHYRYFCPCLPLVYVVASRLAMAHRRPTIVLLALSMGASISCWPLSHSFFNVFSGGPENGYRILAHSSLEWGEDFNLLQTWSETHSDRQPIYLDVANLPYALKALSAATIASDYKRSGWYVVRLQSVNDPQHPASRFRSDPWRERIGYAHAVYWVGEDAGGSVGAPDNSK